MTTLTAILKLTGRFLWLLMVAYANPVQLIQEISESGNEE